MNVSVYLRKSRSDPEDESIDETLSRHKRTLLEFAAENAFTIIDIYEEVVSGDGLFVRPEMIRLLSAIEDNNYEGVLCMDIDRLGRVDTKDRGIILDTFKSHDTKIITPRKIYDLNDDIDEFSTEIEMLLARQELKKITRRMQAGVRRTVEDGFHVGEPPYGYKRIYVNKRPTLEIVENEAAVVKKIFDMYVNEHIGSRIIADTINSMGFKTRKNTEFSRNTISFILQNEIYIGKIIWNKRKHIKKRTPADKSRSVLNPTENWIIADGIHDSIIDKRTFEKAQEIRKTRSHPPSNTGEIKNPFAGLIFCKKCGKLMSGQISSRKSPRLICTQKKCNKSIALDKVEVSVLKVIKNIFIPFELQSDSFRINEKTSQKKNELKSKIKELKKQLGIVEQQKDSLYDLFEQGVYDLNTFQHREIILKTKSDTLTELICKAKADYEKADDVPDSENFIPSIELLLDSYNLLSAKEKNIFLKKIFQKIYYFRPHESDSPFEIELILKDSL